MTKQALPCIVCGGELNNVTKDSDNQPYDGTAFVTHGHYGSTTFDPMDGTYLEVNICDPCLTQAQLKSEVLWGRDSRPVLSDGVVVGGERVSRPLIPWTGEGSFDEVDVAQVDVEEVGTTIKNIEWTPGGEAWAIAHKAGKAG